MTGHDTGTAAEDFPSKKRSDESVSESDPGGCKTELPSELSGVSDEDNRREVGSTEGESRQPRTYVTSAEYKSVYVGGMLSAAEADEDHQCEEAYKQRTSQRN